MILDPLFYLVAIPAVLLVGISKGGFGGGLGMLAVPALALVIDPFTAASIMLPILCVMDLFSIYQFRGKADWYNLKILVGAAIIGIVIGTFTFHYLNDNQIKLLVGALALAFVANTLFKPNTEAKPPSVIRGGIFGAIAGFASFGVHAGGPPVNMYLLPLKLNKTVFVGTTVFFFTSVNFIKLVPYTLLGQFDTANLTTALVLMPLAPLGVYLGKRLHNILSEALFYKVCYVLLALSGLKLVFDAVMGMLNHG